MARSTYDNRFRRATVRMRWTVEGAIPSRAASWIGPSRSRIRRLTHRFATTLLVFFGEDFGRDERSFMDSPAR
ncbi:hypothetical protein HMPREF3099_01035 [Kytococcus sp. HMSC28H12]|nr:hypothetical protein HMPREF3099_01035 [Kytococcus sp. HMSC28H12]